MYRMGWTNLNHPIRILDYLRIISQGLGVFVCVDTLPFRLLLALELFILLPLLSSYVIGSLPPQRQDDRRHTRGDACSGNTVGDRGPFGSVTRMLFTLRLWP